MKLGEIGEREIIEKIIMGHMRSDNEFLDEDAIGIKLGQKYIIINVDTFVRSTDAPKGMDYYSMGWKTVTMTLSDVIAKGGKPISFLCSLSAMGDMDIEFIDDIFRGIENACTYYGCNLEGGDFGESNDLVITGIGVGLSEKYIPRSGARIGDSVWVTGEFSIPAVALHYLLHNGKPIGDMDRILDMFYRPKIDPNIALVLRKIATSAIDSSDGLAVSLNDVARLSKKEIVIEVLPIAREVYEYARINDLDPYSLAMFCGEEFEIVFTTSKPDDIVLNAFEEQGLRKPIKIGYVSEGEGVYFDGRKIPRKGWEHFKK